MAKSDPGYDLPGVAGALAREHAGGLIADLTATQAQTVASLVARAVEQGWSKGTLKARLKTVIGLDPRRALAVDNYRQGLEQAGRSPGQVKRMVDAYARRMLNQRLDSIARTEVANIMGLAQREVWAVQQQTGLLSPYAVRVTRVHRDDRECPQCRAQNGRRRSLQDVRTGPPFHPGCRCSEECIDEGINKTDPSLVYVPAPLKGMSTDERPHKKGCKCKACKNRVKKEDEHDETVCIMAIPAKTDPVHGIGPEKKHATLLYFGDQSKHKDPDRMKTSKGLLLSVLRTAASTTGPFTAQVTKVKPLGHDDPPAQVWLLDSPDLQRLFKDIPDIDSEVKSLYDDADATRYPSYTPHVTIGYSGETEVPDGAEDVGQITFDRLSLWWGNEHIDVPLGVRKDEPRDGDGDGFVLDGKPGMRPVTPKVATFVPPGRRSGKDPYFVSAKDAPDKYGEQYHGLKQKSGALVRGTPIDPADPRIPERLFHVTPVKADVAKSGRLMAGGSGGLNGDKKDMVVSLTTDADIAENLERSMGLMIVAARGLSLDPPTDGWTGEPDRVMYARSILAWFQGDMIQSNALGDTQDEIEGSPEWMAWRERTIKAIAADEIDFASLTNSYFWMRQGVGEKTARQERNRPKPEGLLGRHFTNEQWEKVRANKAETIEKTTRNPLFFDANQEVWAAYNPNDVGIVRIDKKDLLRKAGKQRPDGRPLMTDFDLGKNGLEEVRVYGDVPLDIRWATEAAMESLWHEGRSASEVKIDNNKQVNDRVREKVKQDPALEQHYKDVGKEHLAKVEGMIGMAEDPIVKAILPDVFLYDGFDNPDAHDAFRQKAREYGVYEHGASVVAVVSFMSYEEQKTFWETCKKRNRASRQRITAERKLISLEKQKDESEETLTREGRMRTALAHSLAPMDAAIGREIMDHPGTLEEAATHGALMMKTRAAIDGWASTSLDHDTHALALQRAAYERFKDRGYDAEWESVLDYLGGDDEVWDEDEDGDYRMVNAKDHWRKRIDARYLAEKEYYDAIVDSMYEATQKWLKDNGIEKVYLYRGMSIPRSWVPDDVKYGDTVEVGQNPLGSWAWERQVASGFAGARGGRNDAAVVFEAEFDAADIFSTAVNGLGCHSEKEFVVLGKSKMELRLTEPNAGFEEATFVFPHLNQPYDPGQPGDPDDPDDFGTLPSGPPPEIGGVVPVEGQTITWNGTQYEWNDDGWLEVEYDPGDNDWLPLVPAPDIEMDAAQADVEEIMGLLEPTGTTGEPKYEGGPGWLPPGLGEETAKKKSIGSIYYDPMGKGWKKNSDGSWSPAKAKAAKKTAKKAAPAKKTAAKKAGAIKAAASQPPDFTHLTHNDPADFVIEVD